MNTTTIRRMGLLAAFVTLGTSAIALTDDSQIKISRALNSPTLAVKYSGVRAALVELRLNGESFGTRTMDEAAKSGETTFSLDILALKDGDNEVEIRLYDKAGHLVGSEKTVITTDSTTKTKGAIFLTTPKIGDNVAGPVEISVGFGKEFKNSYVSFFVDNQFKSMINFPPFIYNWDTARETNGWHELEAWVVDDTSATFKTRKVRVFVNNPGGQTPRLTSKPVVKTPAPKIATKTPALKTVKGIPVLPEPRTEELALSANQVSIPAGKAVGAFKIVAQTQSTVSVAKTSALVPSVWGIMAGNLVRARLEGQSANVKPTVLPASTAMGPRLMAPTGKRLVAAKATQQTPAVKTVTKTAAVVEKPATAVAAPAHVTENPVKAPVKAVEAPAKVMASGFSTILAVMMPVKIVIKTPAQPVVKPAEIKAPATTEGIVTAVAPQSHTESSVVALRSLSPALTGDAAIAKPAAHSMEPAKPIVAAAVKPVALVAAKTPAVKAAVVKAASKPAAKIAKVSTIEPLKRGAILPKSIFSVFFKGEPMKFDVAPSVEQGVPVAPFRHLVEKSGGEIKWDSADQEVEVTSDGRNIWLKIGDKLAKINSLQVTLELAPFLKAGRTMVPLSFVKDALNVNIDYDKATGHVLITPRKKA